MDAIVVAGGIPLPEDPLYLYSEGRPKALIDVAGKPMVQWVVDALDTATKVDNVVIVGLPAKSRMRSSKPAFYVQGEGQILANIAAGVEKIVAVSPQAEYALIVAADIPALTGEMIDWLVNQVEGTSADVCYGVVPRQVMERRYPNSRRTWTPLKDMDVCGADINALRINMITEQFDLLETLIGNRKSAWKQAAALGYDTLLQFLLRRFTPEGAAARISERLGIDGRVVIWPWAEAGMDADKPHQLEILREDLTTPRPERSRPPLAA